MTGYPIPFGYGISGERKGESWALCEKRTFTKALPPGTRIIVRKGERFAEWLDAKKKRRTAPVTTGQDGTDRIVITAETYTAKYRDVAGAVESLPSLPLAGGAQRQAIVAKATGTDDYRGSRLAPAFAPTADKSPTGYLSAADKDAPVKGSTEKAGVFAVNACPVKHKGPLTPAVNRPWEVERRRVELPTSALRRH